MTHRRAVGLMVLVTLMWSIAGVVTRWLHTSEPFEVTFWRSLFNALTLCLLLVWWRGPRHVAHAFQTGGTTLWLSGLCWGVMFTAFMVAITMTTVANVLVTMALAPLFTALLARFALGHRLAARTWWAIAAAGAGIAWMYGADVQGAGARHLLGVGVALGVPVAAAVNWTLIQRSGGRHDMLPAVLVGALVSTAITLPMAWPFGTSAHDIALLAMLGAVQLAIPCLMAVSVARVLPAPELSLLALLEVIFGVAWAWLGAGEAPSASVLGGGAVVLGALIVNEWVALGSAKAANNRLPAA